MVEDVDEESDGMIEDEEDDAMADDLGFNDDQARLELESVVFCAVCD